MIDLMKLAEKLVNEHSLTTEEYRILIDGMTPELQAYLRLEADKVRRRVYGNKVFVRGLIEVSNICKNDCYYCGIRRSNDMCSRYRLSGNDILDCCEQGFEAGFRTFVLQGGENAFFCDDVICGIIKKIKSKYPECAVTISLGERPFQSYKKMFDAGADRYLLRHEAVNGDLYARLHPPRQKLENRLDCLNDLKKIGFQTGCGFMVGAPFQTSTHIAEDLKFIENFKPEMCGIGPFIPHKNTEFRDFSKGDTNLTCFLLSIVRIILPSVLLPATTALGTACDGGREQGILSGANVVMPNLSPLGVREKYELYDNKLTTGSESAGNLNELKTQMENIGYKVVCERGDFADFKI